MLIDDVTIKVQAGKGGKGGVYFNSNLMSLGPTGGRGGNGGNVYVEGVSDLGALRQFRYKKEIIAEDGENGKKKLNDGTAGEDIVLKVPVGTVLHNLDVKKDKEITKVGEKVLIATGGFGGHGNYHFRSGKNTSPRQFQPGLPGEAFTMRMEVKLIADVGLIGYPNAGKYSLLNELTAAKSKVANYPFTTLFPNIGAIGNKFIADIPGLIENASIGKGLGIGFLKHIEKVSVLLHCISVESSDILKDYEIVRNELGKYNKELLNKKEIILLTKSDLVDVKKLTKKTKILSKISNEIY